MGEKTAYLDRPTSAALIASIRSIVRFTASGAEGFQRSPM